MKDILETLDVLKHYAIKGDLRAFEIMMDTLKDKLKKEKKKQKI